MSIKVYAFCLVSMTTAVFAQPLESSATVTGQAAITSSLSDARAAALRDAMRRATEEVIGTVVQGETLVRDYELVKDVLYTRSSGFARVLEVLSESNKDGVYTLRARIAVSRAPLEQEVRGLLARLGDPRVLVLLPERLAGVTSETSTAEGELAQQLNARGFRLLEPTQSEQVALRAQNLANSPEALRALAARFGAEVLIGGLAQASVIANPPSSVRDAGLQSVTAKLELRVIDTASGQLLYSTALNAGGLGLSPETAAQTAFKNALTGAVAPLSNAVLSWLVGADHRAGRAFVLRLEGVPNFRVYSSLLTQLREQAAIKGVTSRAFDVAGSEAALEFDGSPEELAILLDTLHCEVLSLSGAEVHARFRP